MRPVKVVDEIKRKTGAKSDGEIGRVLGVTSARVGQLRGSPSNLTANQVASYLLKARKAGEADAFGRAIRPILEMYPIKAHQLGKGKKWEPLATKGHTRNKAIRTCLEGCRGLYVFYDSTGCAIYVGQTEHQNLWKEMVSAFNRERSNHHKFIVAHPSTGQSFKPAYEKPRQPQRKTAILHSTAHYFSAYEVAKELIPTLEALLVRAFCNTLSNKKMEKF